MVETSCPLDCYKKYRNTPKFGKGRRRIPSLRSGRGQQRGMTLLVGLILLVMLMSISVVGFRNTSLSERMTGNVVDRNTSFQSAENAGKEALAVIEAGSFNGATLGHYNPALSGGGNTNFWNQGAGATTSTCTTTTPFSWTSCAAEVTTKYTNNADKAKYVIEQLSQTTTSSGGSTTTTTNYRVTSRSTGGSGNAEVVLQVLYTKAITTTP
ncbi:PilX N-terminal domain-containing pilus assembly protein [Polaromonas sp. YR568]|uniref:pilus assembly PilX family protein n=1 Tax=Polaromonas sp. YR568 TaxID=1855301 RepID=UPI001587B58B|nr:PilX N-terminal domain-containing pilus assembly protein [Polaromonas sp. YR568]